MGLLPIIIVVRRFSGLRIGLPVNDRLGVLFFLLFFFRSSMS